VFLYIIVIYYFKRVSKLIQLDWDVSTITPGDYTVQYEITDTAYDTFMSEVYPASKAKGISTGEALKKYLRDEFERMLTEKLREMRAEGTLGSGIKISEVKIADIVFAFDNSELIDLLRERGGHIMY